MSELEIIEALIAIIILVCTVCFGLLFGITDVLKYEIDLLQQDISSLKYYIDAVNDKVEDLIDDEQDG